LIVHNILTAYLKIGGVFRWASLIFFLEKPDIHEITFTYTVRILFFKIPFDPILNRFYSKL